MSRLSRTFARLLAIGCLWVLSPSFAWATGGSDCAGHGHGQALLHVASAVLAPSFTQSPLLQHSGQVTFAQQVQPALLDVLPQAKADGVDACDACVHCAACGLSVAPPNWFLAVAHPQLPTATFPPLAFHHIAPDLSAPERPPQARSLS